MDKTDPVLDPAHRPRKLDRVAAQLIGRGGQARGACSAYATTASTVSSSPGSRAARQSGSRLKVVWLSGQYQRAMRVPRGLLRA